MAVRKIEYIVTAVGLNPATIQQGGVQGEHRATEVVFNLDKLYTELENMKTNGKRLIYRIDGYDGEGGIHRSDTSELENKEIHYFLEERLTRQGGSVKIVLVISLILNDETEMELYSFPAVIQLRNLPDGKTVESENYESISTLAEVTKANAEIAESSMMVAVDAKEKTELAKAALEVGTEWVFDGGNATDEVDIEFVVDNEVSASSNNPVANSAITKYVQSFDENFDAFTEYVVDLCKSVLLDAHPVGSLYFSSDAADPSTLFGGTWARVEDKFILAAGTAFSVGDTGGEITHTLTVDELPAHNHALHFAANPGVYFSVPSGSTAIDWGNHPNTVQNTGGNSPHNNMPPYEAYYCWKRTK